jgi:hypothetical protein
MSSANSFLQTASQKLQEALDHQTQGNHGSAKKSMQSAAAAIAAAKDPTASATQLTGAQASNGQQPRDFSAAAIAKRLFGTGSTRGARK